MNVIAPAETVSSSKAASASLTPENAAITDERKKVKDIEWQLRDLKEEKLVWELRVNELVLAQPR